MTENTPTQTRPTPIQSEADTDYDRVMAALRAALGDSDLIVQLDEAVGARLVQAEDEVIKTSIESQVAALRAELEQLRQQLVTLAWRVERDRDAAGGDVDDLRSQLATEVRTRRLVVVGPDGFERVVAEAREDIGLVSVVSRKEMRISLVADEQGAEGSAQLYLSAGGNGAGSFSVVESGEYITGPEGESQIDPDTLEYVTQLRIEPDSSDPRFHDITLDREGLSFGG